MYQVKLFDIYNQDLEEAINTWFKGHQEVALIDIKYNINDDGDYALLIYKE